MNSFKNKQSGLIQWIIIIIVVILILSYFGFDIRALINDPQTQDNFSVVWGFVVDLWEDYLRIPVLWIWNNIVSFIWNDLFLDNLARLHDGETFTDIAPEIPEAPASR